MKTIDGLSEYEEIIKKSRFIARAARSDTPESALEFLNKIRDTDATHNCWAYKIDDAYRFSDDGEPGGTAGRPVFMAIEQQNFDHVMVVVTRFFGGVKLGAGGLARAYGGVTGKCLQHARIHVVRDHIVCRLTVSFEHTGVIYPLLDSLTGVHRLAETYIASGIEFVLRMPADDYGSFKQDVTEALSGNVDLEMLRTERL